MTERRNSTPVTRDIAVPATLAEALDPAWLSLAFDTKVIAVRQVELIRTVATKVRFAVTFVDDTTESFCLKGLLDVDEQIALGGPTCVLEADFYGKVAPHCGVRVPDCVVSVIDRERQQSVIIMRDLITGGVQFCSALEAFNTDEAATSLEQIALRHQASHLLEKRPWITPRAAELARANHIPVETLQEMLNGPRGSGLPEPVRDAGRLIAALRALAERDEARPRFLVHGDAHAGNIFRSSQGMGLIDWQLLQRGGWALDVAYHINAVLPVETAETEERRLLGHYLGVMRAAGHQMPDDDTAWREYREAVIYGYYLWSITRRVDPPIIDLFVGRLGRAVARHDTHGLLGIG